MLDRNVFDIDYGLYVYTTNKNILTVTAHHFYKYNIDELADSIAFYYNKEKGKIVFNSEGEGLAVEITVDFIRLAKKLNSDYGISSENMVYVSGGLPIRRNIELYKMIDGSTILPMNMINSVELQAASSSKKYIQEVSNIEHKPKKFISMNGEPKLHRVYFTMLMLERDLLKEGYYSFGVSPRKFSPEVNLSGFISYEYYPKLSDKVSKLLEDNIHQFPMFLSKTDVLDKSHYKPEDSILFNEARFNIVLETNYSNTFDMVNYKKSIFITEKTYRSIAYKIPFICLNVPYSLQAMRDYGYKTFHPYIDESYDLIEDDEDRLVAVVNEIERLCKLSDNEWLTIQRAIEPIVEYNYQKLMAAKIYLLEE